MDANDSVELRMLQSLEEEEKTERDNEIRAEDFPIIPSFPEQLVAPSSNADPAALNRDFSWMASLPEDPGSFGSRQRQGASSADPNFFTGFGRDQSWVNSQEQPADAFNGDLPPAPSFELDDSDLAVQQAPTAANDVFNGLGNFFQPETLQAPIQTPPYGAFNRQLSFLPSASRNVSYQPQQQHFGAPSGGFLISPVTSRGIVCQHGDDRRTNRYNRSELQDLMENFRDALVDLTSVLMYIRLKLLQGTIDETCQTEQIVKLFGAKKAIRMFSANPDWKIQSEIRLPAFYHKASSRTLDGSKLNDTRNAAAEFSREAVQYLHNIQVVLDLYSGRLSAPFATTEAFWTEIMDQFDVTDYRAKDDQFTFLGNLRLAPLSEESREELEVYTRVFTTRCSNAQ
ncbi:hypothetical protein NKR23_g8413 [Pleurostoma richardsiae]|uniref:Uncharacterized protein n=1 Tax=Pleurostoma richardsiae TaxID=41990 RepID=A0AA38RTI2_9PEZI|nr:hypothetical protein NKR23_g8413 [Pleurostoma richardsiae]